MVRQPAKPMAQPQPAGDAEEPLEAEERDLGRNALDLRREAILTRPPGLIHIVGLEKGRVVSALEGWE